ncbi:glutathione peroxidase [Planctomyces sp. SH-PL62]|uniref:glutathione peroxidase n=1 Tax=Planctomyces sp. SH-PL62 TaxID=1636152 RepID=UPI000A80CDFD
MLGRILIACTILPALGLILASFATTPTARADDKKPTSVLDFHVKDIDGGDVALSQYQGKVLLIVNTASQCGLTPQYKGLEEVYKKYKDQGLEVLAFPANEFGAQEPGSDEQIKEFCSTKYNVTFPLFSKIVVKGEGINPLYSFLTSETTNPSYAGPIGWNFAKFLVNRKGEVIARFDPKTTPESPEVQAALEKALAEK